MTPPQKTLQGELEAASVNLAHAVRRINRVRATLEREGEGHTAEACRGVSNAVLAQQTNVIGIKDRLPATQATPADPEPAPLQWRSMPQWIRDKIVPIS